MNGKTRKPVKTSVCVLLAAMLCFFCTACNKGGKALAEAAADAHVAHYVGDTQYSFYVDDEGALYACGKNERGQLGMNDSRYAQHFAPVKIMEDVLTATASKTLYSLALKTNGEVWAWGYNERSQLGQDTGYNDDGKTNTVAAPQKIPFEGGAVMKSIAAGKDAAFALDDGGNVWSWGGNNGAQLGRGLNIGRKSVYGKPAKIDAAYFGGKKADQITASDFAAFALTEDGAVYSWGANDRCQLGTGKTDVAAVQNTPEEIVALRGKNVIKISAMSENCMALTESGEAYIWGSNILRQLGVPDRVNEAGLGVNAESPVPLTLFADTEGQRIETPVKIKDIACGGVTNAVLDRDGYLYAFGDGSSGACGFDAQKAAPADKTYVSGTNVLAPVRVKFYEPMDILKITEETPDLAQSILPVTTTPKDVRIVKITGTAGARTFVEDDGGTVWSFGNNLTAQGNSGNVVTLTRPVKSTFFRVQNYDVFYATPDYLTGPLIVIGVTLALFFVGIAYFEVKRRKQLQAERESLLELKPKKEDFTFNG